MLLLQLRGIKLYAITEVVYVLNALTFDRSLGRDKKKRFSIAYRLRIG